MDLVVVFLHTGNAHAMNSDGSIHAHRPNMSHKDICTVAGIVEAVPGQRKWKCVQLCSPCEIVAGFWLVVVEQGRPRSQAVADISSITCSSFNRCSHVVFRLWFQHVESTSAGTGCFGTVCRHGTTGLSSALFSQARSGRLRQGRCRMDQES